MKRMIQALTVPPLAVCRYGCAGCCAAPIGVFWIAGVVSLIYAFFGGPTGQEGISSGTLMLGIILWAIASLWASNTIRNVDGDNDCKARPEGACKVFRPSDKFDDSDPMDEVKKFQR